MNTFDLKDKTVAVTGCYGTIGSELVRQLVKRHRVGRIIGLDNNESGLFHMEQQLNGSSDHTFLLTDVRDCKGLINSFRGADVVFHTAAYKHVYLCEKSPFEAVQTNIHGVNNVIRAALENKVKRTIFTSSDKAVNPTNVMGTSKLMGERLISAAATTSGSCSVLASTRFGNVLGSRGSVVPLFMEQIRRGGPVTLTHKDMSRFIMTIEEAVRLVIESASLACGGEVFVTKMPVIRILDLAEVMLETVAPLFGRDPADVGIKVIGVKPGEKMYEELLSNEEAGRTWELDSYFAVLPAYRDAFSNVKYEYTDLVSTDVKGEYNSSRVSPMTRKELKDYLSANGLLSPPYPGHAFRAAQ